MKRSQRTAAGALMLVILLSAILSAAVSALPSMAFTVDMTSNFFPESSTGYDSIDAFVQSNEGTIIIPEYYLYAKGYKVAECKVRFYFDNKALDNDIEGSRTGEYGVPTLFQDIFGTGDVHSFPNVDFDESGRAWIGDYYYWGTADAFKGSDPVRLLRGRFILKDKSVKKIGIELYVETLALYKQGGDPKNENDLVYIVKDGKVDKSNSSIAKIGAGPFSLEEGTDLIELADNEAVKAVTDRINALPKPENVKTSDKAAIEAARAAYDKLNDRQKAKVPESVLKKLTDDEAALKKATADEADAKAAKAVADMINALPKPENVKTSDKAAIEAARAAYDKLTDAQKKKVPADVYKKLTDDEAALKKALADEAGDKADAKAAQAVIDKINALPSPENVKTSDKDAIEAARAAYDKLTDAQKKKIPADVYKKLTDDEAALKKALDKKCRITVDMDGHGENIVIEVTPGTNVLNEMYDLKLLGRIDGEYILYCLYDKPFSQMTSPQDYRKETELPELYAETDHTVYAIWLKRITGIKLVVESPAPGTVVETYGDNKDKKQTNPPVLKCRDPEEPAYEVVSTRWIRESDFYGYTKTSYTGTLEEGKEYTYTFRVQARFGYIFDRNAIYDEENKIAYISVKNRSRDELSFISLTSMRGDIVCPGYFDVSAYVRCKNAEEEEGPKLSGPFTVEATSNLFPAKTAHYDDIDELRDENGNVFITVEWKMKADKMLLVNLGADGLTWDNTVLEFKEAYNTPGEGKEGKKEKFVLFPFAYEQGIGGGIVNTSGDTNSGKIAGNYTSVSPAAHAYNEKGEKIVVVRAVFKILKATEKTTVNLNMDTLSLCDDSVKEPYPQYAPVSGGKVSEEHKKLAQYDTVIKPYKSTGEAVITQDPASTDDPGSAEEPVTAQDVAGLVDKIPDPDKITLGDKDKIKEAMEEYGKLTDEEKAKLPKETVDKLIAADTIIDILELPDPDKVTLDDKEAIKDAKKKYDELTEDQKKLIPQEVVDKIFAEDTIIDILLLPDPDKVTLDDKEAIKDAKKKYDELTEDQKKLIPQEIVDKIFADDAIIDILELPDPDKITLDDREAIKDAKKKYDELTEDQKKLIPQEIVDKIFADDAIIDILELPDPDKITLDDREAIEAARKKYDSLTEAQKKLIPPEVLQKLLDAEKALRKLEGGSGDGIPAWVWILVAALIVDICVLAGLMIARSKKKAAPDRDDTDKKE